MAGRTESGNAAVSASRLLISPAGIAHCGAAITGVTIRTAAGGQSLTWRAAGSVWGSGGQLPATGGPGPDLTRPPR